MPAPVASGWSESPGGACTHWKSAALSRRTWENETLSTGKLLSSMHRFGPNCSIQELMIGAIEEANSSEPIGRARVCQSNPSRGIPMPPREKQKPGSCRQRGDLNGVAEVLQTHDEASGVDGFGPLVEGVRAEIAIERTADQHVVDAGQDRGGERAERLFGAAAGAQAVELGLEIAGLLAGGGRGALHEGGLEPRGPLAHPSRSALAGALVVFRAQA